MPPRGEHSRAELQELILEAAQELAAEYGLKGLTARAIARRAGYSPGSIYNVFKDLDDVIVAMNGRTLDALYEHLKPLPGDPDPETAILALARAYIVFIRERPRLWSVLFEHTLPEEHELPDWFHERVQKLLGLISTALAPLFGPDEAQQRDHSARILWAATQGISSLASTGKLLQAESVGGMLRALVTYHVRGLRASEVHPDFATGGVRSGASQ